MKKLNELQKIMKTRIVGLPLNGPGITKAKDVGAPARWLRKHKQTNNGKTFEKI